MDQTITSGVMAGSASEEAEEALQPAKRVQIWSFKPLAMAGLITSDASIPSLQKKR